MLDTDSKKHARHTNSLESTWFGQLVTAVDGNPKKARLHTHLGVRHAVAVRALDVETNPGSLALVDGVLVVHVLHEVPPPFPVPVVVPPVHLQRRPEVVRGLDPVCVCVGGGGQAGVVDGQEGGGQPSECVQ